MSSSYNRSWAYEVSEAKFADKFVLEMKKSPVASLIESYSIDDSSVDPQKVQEHFYNNLPLYMEEKNYRDIENNLNGKNIEKILGVIYRNMISPAGLVSAPMLRKDPFGLSFQAMEKLKKLNPEKDFTLVGKHIFTKDKKNLIFFIQPGGSAVETGRNAELVAKIQTVLDF